MNQLTASSLSVSSPLYVPDPPCIELDELSRELGAEIWIKRDDLTGFALGGNKARKAEFLLADALQKDCDVILTAGAVQSNHTESRRDGQPHAHC